MPAFPIYATQAIRKLEELAAPASGTLMERAGDAAAEFARGICGDTAKSVLVIAGPGNNGGDAFEVAAHLKRWFFRVRVVFSGERDNLSKDARAALAKWEAEGGGLEKDIPADVRFDLAVDGLFGIGLTRALAGEHAALVGKLNALGATVLSLDVPSGINADTGAVMGCAVRASHTLTFIAHKPGLLTLDGPDHCGDLRLDTLGIDPEPLLAPEGTLLDRDVLGGAIRQRPKNFHKGQAGSVGILGGAAGMVGAAAIAGRAALKCAAGLLAPVPIVLDADALNLIAASRALAASLAKRKAGAVLTPHPAEAARLLGITTAGVQADRVASARAIAQRYRSCVVLKGNGSVIAAPDGKFWINPSGNPGMASAGMGDALAGMIAALIAQGAEPLQALLAGVYLHGAAADALVASGVGPAGITASEVIDRARVLLNRRSSNRKPSL